MLERRTIALVVALAVGTGGALLPSPASALTTTRVSQRYLIEATLDVASGRLEAVETLTLTNRAPYPIDHLNLSVIPRALGYLTMDEAVTVDGEPVSTAWTTGTNLRVSLAEPLAADGTAVVRLLFRLDVGATGGAFTARLSRDRGVISFGQWFPILSREHDAYGVGDPQISFNAEQVRLELTATAALPRDAVACAGLVAAPDVSGTGWVCEVEDVRDFSFVVNPAFRLTRRVVGETSIRVYTQTVSGEVTADKAVRALTRLNELYGPYPWPDLVLAEVGATGGFSMEYPRTIHLTREKVIDDYIINHEIAHQWFYAQVGNDQMLEPWLDEAFADFTARLLMGIGENACGTHPVDSPVFNWRAGPASGGDWTSCDGYFHSVFYRGTEFLNSVRARMGDTEFFAAIRDYVEANRFEVVTGRSLLSHLQSWNEADLLPIYRTYLRQYAAPLVPARTRQPLPVADL